MKEREGYVLLKGQFQKRGIGNSVLGKFLFKLERALRSWKEPSEVGKNRLKFESFAEVGKFRYSWKVLTEVEKFK